MRSGSRPPEQHSSRRGWFPFAIASIFFGLFFLLAHEVVFEHDYYMVELQWMEALAMHRTEMLTDALLWVSRAHDGIIASLIIVILTLQIYRRRWRQLRFLLILGPGVMLFSWLAKHVFQRPRPQIMDALISAHGYGFPSGHTITAAATAVMLIHFTWHETTSHSWRGIVVVFAVSLTLVVGFSRVYLGVHYPSDVLASLLEVAAWSCLCIAMDGHRPNTLRTQHVATRERHGSKHLGIPDGSNP